MAIIIPEIRNAKSLSEDNANMDMEINHPEFGWIPYTLRNDDPDNTIDNNQLREVMGQNFMDYIPPTEAEIVAAAEAEIRAERDFLLEEEVDPIVSNNLRWADMSQSERDAWANYRRQLLDITDQETFPDASAIIWPTKPE